MIVGTRVEVVNAESPCWNGEQGTVLSFFTSQSGRRMAVLRMKNIALEIPFYVCELMESNHEETRADVPSADTEED